MSDEQKLKIGGFYWIIVTHDPDANAWENKPMPARYAGDNRWNYLGVEGVSDWPVCWVGAEIFNNPSIVSPCENIITAEGLQKFILALRKRYLEQGSVRAWVDAK